MFTGIINDIGEVFKIGEKKGDKKFFISTNLNNKDIKIGSSLCCSGVCLTVMKKGKKKKKNFFVVGVSEHTLSKSTLYNWKVGTYINIEKSLKVGEELSGHLVFGHIDQTIKVLSIKKVSGSLEYNLELPFTLKKYIVPKGSVSLEGVSLTINDVNQDNFYVNIIEHTKNKTTFKNFKAGNFLNIEIDMLARYVHGKY